MRVGNETIGLWEDNCNGFDLQKNQFSNLYRLAYNPEVLLARILTDIDIRFRRNLFDRKMQEVVFIHSEDAISSVVATCQNAYCGKLVNVLLLSAHFIKKINAIQPVQSQKWT